MASSLDPREFSNSQSVQPHKLDNKQLVFQFNRTFYKSEECLKLQCCGSGSAWFRIKLNGRIRIRIKVISWIRINLQIKAKLYGVSVWTYVSTFSRFWAFLRISKLGSGSASKWKLGSGSESASASINLKKTFNFTTYITEWSEYMKKTFCCTEKGLTRRKKLC